MENKCKWCQNSVVATDGSMFCTNVSRWLTPEEQAYGCLLFKKEKDGLEEE